MHGFISEKAKQLYNSLQELYFLLTRGSAQLLLVKRKITYMQDTIPELVKKLNPMINKGKKI